MNKDREKEKREHRRHVTAYKILRALVMPFFILRYNYHYDSLKKIKGPYLLLCNHNMNVDPISIGIASDNFLYFVASENIVRGGFLSKLLIRYFRPIFHTKGKTGTKSVMEMMVAARAGYSIALFAEGNRSFNGETYEINPSIGKVARKIGIPLVTYRIEGGYFTSPRWSFKDRRGRLTGKHVGTYSVEELKNMGDDEVVALINRDLFENAYETNNREKLVFKGRDLCKGLESTLFVCPACRQIGLMQTDSDSIFCKCGFKGVFLKDAEHYGRLQNVSGLSTEIKFPASITEWDKWQREYIESYIKRDGLLFSDEVEIRFVKNHEITDVLKDTLMTYKDRVVFGGDSIQISDIHGVAIFSRNTMTIHVGEEYSHMEIHGNKAFCALKYLYLYNILNGAEQ